MAVWPMCLVHQNTETMHICKQKKVHLIMLLKHMTGGAIVFSPPRQKQCKCLQWSEYPSVAPACSVKLAVSIKWILSHAYHEVNVSDLVVNIFKNVLNWWKFPLCNPLKTVPESHGRQAEEKSKGSPKLGHQGSPGIDQHLLKERV